MMGFSLESRLVLLLLLLAALCLHRQDPVASVLAAPSFTPENDHDHEGKLSLSPSTMIKTATVSSVDRRGGGGHGGGGRGGGGRGGGRVRGGEEGGQRGGAGSMIPLYAGGAAGAGARSHDDNGAALNRGKPNPGQNVGVAVLLALPLLFKYFG